ncbi:hypothetical protein [Rhizobium sp. RM]|uniref:hypothetical protein n=1 Tax=Rhizobium sp. RM TaxID=2748079 RepID=UPI00110EC0AC|nr:hypothetical protein [Rhizobium sp. RM]NWJ27521.1 hypothetical protein [Rhizobium sp. RM]TMV20016.1 hypothetical protein BJG94_11540 [Rhizobium sp. Td3]
MSNDRQKKSGLASLLTELGILPPGQDESNRNDNREQSDEIKDKSGHIPNEPVRRRASGDKQS